MVVRLNCLVGQTRAIDCDARCQEIMVEKSRVKKGYDYEHSSDLLSSWLATCIVHEPNLAKYLCTVVDGWLWLIGRSSY